jgi:uncharacterized protein YebE (UPF0316 family)
MEIAMIMMTFLDSATYTWVILPILIFFTRIIDVSLGTLRIIFINRSLSYYATISAFFEVLVWLLVLRQIFQQLDNPICFIAYAAGYAAGNYVGIIIENRISIGKVLIRTITRREADELIAFLKSAGYGITVIDAEGMRGPVKAIFTISERIDIPSIVKAIKKFNPHAFYSVEDVRFVSEAILPYGVPAPRKWTHFYSRLRKKV